MVFSKHNSVICGLVWNRFGIKGAGLALQRTYNSQDDRIGPFGIGWTHAYDIRNEEENPDAHSAERVHRFRRKERNDSIRMCASIPEQNAQGFSLV